MEDIDMAGASPSFEVVQKKEPREIHPWQGNFRSKGNFKDFGPNPVPADAPEQEPEFEVPKGDIPQLDSISETSPGREMHPAGSPT